MRAKVKKVKKHLSANQNISQLRLTLAFLVIILLASFNLIVYFSPPKTIVVHAKDSTPLVQVYYLKNILRTNPTYREGWITLAKLQYKLGNNEEAKYALRRAYEIDPNYKEIETLQELLK